jgi:tetrahydromethanopterin S-methyltransferase subunit E
MKGFLIGAGIGLLVSAWIGVVLFCASIIMDNPHLALGILAALFVVTCGAVGSIELR